MTWAGRLPEGAGRGLPLALAAAVFVTGSLVFVWPHVARTLEARRAAASLEERVASMRRQLRFVATGSATGRAVAQSERVESSQADVSVVIERLARLAASLGGPAQVRGLQITTIPDTGSGATGAGAARGPAARDTHGSQAAGASTPIAVRFETTYDRLGLFLWRLRDLPAPVEVRSLEIARSRSLLASTLTLVYARPGAASELTSARTAPVSSLSESPAASRMAADSTTASPAIDLDHVPVWSHDPFVAGERPEAVVQAGARSRAAPGPEPVVTSILYAADRRLAVVDRRTVRIGDRVASGVVADIEPGAVVIRLPSGLLRRVELGRTLTGAGGESRSK
jgi:hypothetical protein